MLDDEIDIKKFTPKSMSNLIGKWKDKGYKPEDLKISDIDYFANGKAINVYKTYQMRLITLNSTDFGDLLLHNLTIFLKHPDTVSYTHLTLPTILLV